MKYKVERCDTVGGAWMVVSIGRFGARRKRAIGLTRFEADCAKRRLEVHGEPKADELGLEPIYVRIEP